MRLDASARVAFLLMRRKPVRSLLSVLGIYIGVLALVVILAMREGVRRHLDETSRTEGASVFIAYPGFDPAGQRMGRLTLGDAGRLRTVPGVLGVFPRLSAQRRVRGAGVTAQITVQGVDDRFLDVFRVPLASGRPFLPREAAGREPVMILTEAAAAELVPLGEPVGARVEVEGSLFEVVGVARWSPRLDARTQLGMTPGALVPWAWLLDGEQESIPVVEIRAEPGSPETRTAERLLSELARGNAKNRSLFAVESLRNLSARMMDLGIRVSGTLLAIAGISLLVGGVGIANVMLTSVAERTREIGIRKAVGARPADIMLQFLVESCLLCASGGLLAVLSAWLGIAILPAVFDVRIPLALPVAPVFACFLLTTGVGLVAGLYPASRAANQAPAEALRFE